MFNVPRKNILLLNHSSATISVSLYGDVCRLVVYKHDNFSLCLGNYKRSDYKYLL